MGSILDLYFYYSHKWKRTKCWIFIVISDALRDCLEIILLYLYTSKNARRKLVRRNFSYRGWWLVRYLTLKLAEIAACINFFAVIRIETTVPERWSNRYNKSTTRKCKGMKKWTPDKKEEEWEERRDDNFFEQRQHRFKKIPRYKFL